MKKIFTLAAVLVSASGYAHEHPTLSQALAVVSFPNATIYKVGTVEEKRAARALKNVEGLCAYNTDKIVSKAIATQEKLVGNGYYVTPVEIVEALGTLKKQAPNDVDCDYVIAHYATTVSQTPTPAEALASVNSLYKILKSATAK